MSDIEQIIKYGIRSNHPKAWNLAIMPGVPVGAQPSARDAGSRRPLSPGHIRDLVEFLLREQGRSMADACGTLPAARNAVHGRPAGCHDCHAVDAKGDPAIGAPNLTDRITLYGDGSRDALAMSLSYGRHGICPAWIGRITAAGIREVAVYVFTVASGRRLTDRAAADLSF